jgi:predicted dehydrogenase
MKFLVVGLGSMGKRRVRCLMALGHKEIYGYDTREDRLESAVALYDIVRVDSITGFNFQDMDGILISTPPDKHNEYLEYAIQYSIPAFVEASVLIDHVKSIQQKITEKPVFIAPSCTLSFHPLVKEIKEIVHSKKYGKITNFSFHSGQYLPDWHPWEDVEEFYVSNRETGGGREIVPFELTWLTEVLGFPQDIKGYFEQTIDFGPKIEDSYSFVMKFNGYIGAIIVDVASRFATRNLILNMEKGQLLWNWNDSCLKVYESDQKRWINYYQPEGNSEAGYNKNIIEEMYIDEIEAYINGVKGATNYPNSIDKDIKILELLNKIEESDGGF